MGGGGHDPGAVRLRRLDDETPGLAQRLAHLGHRAAHPRVSLDLGAQELVDDLVRPACPFAGLEDALVRIGVEVAGFRIDEKELLLDPEGDGKVLTVNGVGHGSLPAPAQPEFVPGHSSSCPWQELFATMLEGAWVDLKAGKSRAFRRLRQLCQGLSN